MRTFNILILWTLSARAQTVWVDMNNNPQPFEDHILQADGITMNQYQLSLFENKNVEQSYLLSKIEFWQKRNLNSRLIDTELKDLRKSHIYSQSNRLILFEYLKSQTKDGSAVTFKNLCHLYANDPYLKTSEPFFEGGCNLTRLSLKELNPVLTGFDFMLIDGNRININQSPYFFSAGFNHQFVFISNRYATIEITGTPESLIKSKILAQPWVEGSCDSITSHRVPAGLEAKGYFPKGCTADIQESKSNSLWTRNKYYIISGVLLAIAASSISSQYELGVTLQN